MVDPCKICGRDMALVGRRHNCRPMTNTAGMTNRDPVDMANTPAMPENMANIEPPHMANTPPPAENVANVTYRYRDPEQRRAYMREYMRARRAARAQEGKHAG